MPSATLNGINIADDPTAPSFVGTTMNIGGGASTIVTASVGKGQGTWVSTLNDVSLNVTTPMQQLKRVPIQGLLPGTSSQDHQSKYKNERIKYRTAIVTFAVLYLIDELKAKERT